MKKIFTSCFQNWVVFSFVILLSIDLLQAQISILPYTETFDKSFVLGNDVDFIPNWLGNEVEEESKLFQTSNKELGLIPTSSFIPEVQVKLNLQNYQNVVVYFKAKSAKNGDGNRSSILTMETSYDGGLTWNTLRTIHTFPNQNGNFSNFQYHLAGAAGNKRPVVVKFTVNRSEGEGTSAQVVIDDVTFAPNQTDIEIPEVISVTSITARRVQVKYNDKMNATALNLGNYQGLPNLSSITPSIDTSIVTLEFSDDFGIGKDLTLTISNVQDKVGNPIAAPYSGKVVYNNTRPSITITEIMYNIPGDQDSLEFLEIYNRGNEVAFLGGLYFSAGLTYTFPEYNLAPKSYVLIAANATAAKNFFGQEFLQWEAGALNNGGENLEIKNSLNQVVTSVKYDRNWGGDGNGRSVSYCSPVNEVGNNDQSNWSSTQKSTGKTVNGVIIYASPNQGCGTVLPEIRFESSSTFAFEGAQILKVKLISVNPNASSSTVTVNLDPATTATLGTDFSSSVSFPSVVQFPLNKREVEINIQILDDNQQEDIEKIIFTLSAPQNAIIGGNGKYVIDILDNDAPVKQICVNEVSASNNSTSGIKDEFGNSDDWVEIKNGSNTDIVIAGYYVTDNPNNLTKYQLPIDDIEALTISAGGFLILWADNETDQGANHLDFALSAAGEYFALVMPDGKTIVSEVTFPALKTNTSYGRTNDCAENWIVFETPTFAASNKPTSIIERENQSSIILYPNPNKGDRVFVSEPIDYLIYDAMGQLKKRGESSTQIDVQDLSNGLYILTTEDGKSTKFIINR